MSSQKLIYQVSDLVNQMRSLMEASYPEIWIEGELSSLSTPASGHLYFTLKDANSQLRCAMFRGRASLSRYKAKAGDLVRVRAKISVYPARGDLQCIVQHIEDAGEGLLQQKYEELKEKLNQEGLFSTTHKLTLPSAVHHLAIITSPTGAAINDILSTLERRNPGIPITIYPSVVQGDMASKALIESIRDVVKHQRCDLIIMGRGGGSLEDLWCFNDEELAREIYACPIPIVSAVGHEVDVSIADLVSDLRAPTPTAAAELVSSDTATNLQKLNSMWQRLGYAYTRQLERLGQQVDICFEKIEHPSASIRSNRKQLNNMSARLGRGIQLRTDENSRNLSFNLRRLSANLPSVKIKTCTNNLDHLTERLKTATVNDLTSRRQHAQSMGSQLNMVSPLATLDRGFSIVRDEHGNIIRDGGSTSIGKQIQVDLKSGQLKCEVLDVDTAPST
jgi:exodeoxyribonuclease VII large subunit